MCRYPLGSGGKRVRILAGSAGAPRCAAAGPGLPPQVRVAYLPERRSPSMMLRMKLEAGAPLSGLGAGDVALLTEDPRRSWRPATRRQGERPFYTAPLPCSCHIGVIACLPRFRNR